MSEIFANLPSEMTVKMTADKWLTCKKAGPMASA